MIKKGGVVISYLLDNTNFSGTISKYIDLPNDKVIKNGILYNKYSGVIAQNNTTSFGVKSIDNKIIIKNNTYLLKNNISSTGTITNSFNAILQDNNDVNLFYIISKDYNNNDYLYFLNTVTPSLFNININNIDTKLNQGNTFVLIGQDSDDVYCMGYNSGYITTIFFKVNKKSTKITKVGEINGNFPTIIENNSSSITSFNCNSDNFNVNYIDFKNNIIINTNNISINKNYNNINNTFCYYNKIDESVYFITNSLLNETDWNFYKYNNNKLIKLKLNNNLITLDSSLYFFKTFVYKDTKINKDFLILTINSPIYYSDLSNNDMINKNIIYLFEINEEELTLVYEYPLSFLCTDIIYQEDKNILICSSDKKINILKVDNNTIVSIFENTDGLISVGIDTGNDIIIQTKDTSVYKLSKTTDSVYGCYFEKNIYKFNGTPITTYLEFYVKNYLGDYLKKNVSLTLIGNIQFEDGTTYKEIESSKEGVIRVPIIIKTNTQFNCEMKVV